MADLAHALASCVGLITKSSQPLGFQVCQAVGAARKMLLERKPADSKRRPSPTQWFLAGLLTIVAELSGTLATFMPMKSVFILAADGVPGFFPAFLVERGPLVTALFLLVLSGLFAGVAALSKSASGNLAMPEAKFPDSQGVKVPRTRTSATNRFTLGEFALVGLATILFSVSALFSILFTALVACWIAVSWAALRWMTHRRAPAPPFATSSAEFQFKFRKWMVGSSLWATVGAAIVTLVATTPQFGITAILLDSVLLMRFQRAIGELGSRLIRSKDAPDAGTLVGNQRRSRELFPPIDYLATELGQQRLRSSVRDAGLELSNWRIPGRSNRVQGTLLSRHEGTQRWVMLRVFAIDESHARDREILMRSELGDSAIGLLRSASIRGVEVGGLPGIITDWEESTLVPDESISGEEALVWHREFESKCLAIDAIQQRLSAAEVTDPNDFLLPQLRGLVRFRGPQRKPILDVIENMTEIRRLYMSGDRTYGLSGGSGPANFVKFQDGGIEPIDLTRLEIAPIGAFWGENPGMARQILKKKSGRGARSQQQIEVNSQLRAAATSLARACQGRDFAAMGTHATQLLALYQISRGNPESLEDQEPAVTDRA